MIFRSAIVPRNLRHRRLSWATTHVFKIHTGIVRFLVLAFVDVLSQSRTEIVGKSYGNRRVSAHFKCKSYVALAMSVRRTYAF